MSDPKERSAWHLDKTFSLSHLFSTLAAIITLAVVGVQFHTRLSLVEQAIIVQHGTEARQDLDVAEFKREMREITKGINDKLDRLIERQR